MFNTKSLQNKFWYLLYPQVKYDHYKSTKQNSTFINLYQLHLQVNICNQENITTLQKSLIRPFTDKIRLAIQITLTIPYNHKIFYTLIKHVTSLQYTALEKFKRLFQNDLQFF